jgi:thiol-disulfide isomerase/thioredoxin
MHALSWARVGSTIAVVTATSLFASSKVGSRCEGCDHSAATSEPAPEDPIEEPVTLVFFWREGCPHCEAAKPMVEALARDYPDLRIERVEVWRDPEGAQCFVETMKRLGTSAEGVPTFVVGDAYEVGYEKGKTDARVRALVERALASRR